MKLNSKVFFVVLSLVIFMAVGCTTATIPAEKKVVSVVTPASAEEKPVVVEQTKSEAQKIDTPVVVEQKEVSKDELNHKYIYEYGDYSIEIDAHDGYGYVTYPSFITDKEISQALSEFIKAYGDFGVTYKKLAPGSLYVQYPKDLTKADFDYVANIAGDSLTWYLGQLLVEQPKLSTPVAEIKDENNFNYEYVYEFAGYEILADLYNGYAYVTYPNFITDQEISDALTAFVKAYGDFGVTYEKTIPGRLKVYYPKDLTKADFDYVASVAAENLDWYLNQMFATEEVAIETSVVVEQTKAEEPKVEKPVVVDQPKVEETKLEAKVEQPKEEAPVVVEQPKVETTVVATEPTVEKKGISAIWIILIILVVIVVALYCFFCLFKKLTIKELWNTIKEKLEGNK